MRIKAIYLLDLVKNLKEFVNDGAFLIDSSGLRLSIMDKPNVCLIEATVKPSLIEELKEIKFKVDLKNFYNILNDNKKKSVKLTIEENNLNLIFDDGFNFKLPLIEIEDDFKDIPNMEFKTEAVLNSKRFKEIVKNMSLVSDSLKIEKKGDTLIFNAGNLNKSEIVLNDVQLKGDDCSCKYSLEYLLKMVKSPINEELTLKLNSDYPLKLSYLGDFELNYLLAPRVEGD